MADVRGSRKINCDPSYTWDRCFNYYYWTTNLEMKDGVIVVGNREGPLALP